MTARVPSPLQRQTAAWTGKRLRATTGRFAPSSAAISEARSDAFRAFADVEFGEIEALLRVERAA